MKGFLLLPIWKLLVNTARTEHDNTVQAVNYTQGTAIGVVSTSLGPAAPVITFGANSLNQDVNIMANSKNINEAVRNLNKNGSPMW